MAYHYDSCLVNLFLGNFCGNLCNVRQEGTSHDLNYNSKIMTLDDQFKANYSSSVRMTRKRTRQNALEKEARLISFENDQANSVERESTENTCKETASGKVSF